MDYNLIKYLPGLATVSRQGYIPKKAYVSSHYTEKKMLEFNLLLAANTYTNYSSLMIVANVYKKSNKCNIKYQSNNGNGQ